MTKSVKTHPALLIVGFVLLASGVFVVGQRNEIRVLIPQGTTICEWGRAKTFITTISARNLVSGKALTQPRDSTAVLSIWGNLYDKPVLMETFSGVSSFSFETNQTQEYSFLAVSFDSSLKEVSIEATIRPASDLSPLGAITSLSGLILLTWALLGRSQQMKKKVTSGSFLGRIQRIVRVIILVVTIAITVYWVVNAVFPFTWYPTSDLNSRKINLSNETPSIIVTNVPVHAKQLIDVEIEDIWADVRVRNDITLVSEADEDFTIGPIRFAELDKIASVQAFREGNRLSLKVAEESGKKYYHLPEMSLKGGGVANSIEVVYTISRSVNYSRIVQSPWPFYPDRFAPLVHIPFFAVPVQKGHETEKMTLTVHFRSAYYRLNDQLSGWNAVYSPQKWEWQRYGRYVQGELQPPWFEYPIDQNYQTHDGVSVFTAYFSEVNFATRLTLVFVPTSAVFLFGLSFLLCVYVPDGRRRVRKDDMTNSRWLFVAESYAWALAFDGLGTILDFSYLSNTFSQLIRIGGVPFVACLLLFPLGYGLVARNSVHTPRRDNQEAQAQSTKTGDQ